MIQNNILRKISRLVIYARDLTPLPTTKVPTEFSGPRIKHDLECIDGWLSDQFKDNQHLERDMRKGGGLNP